MLATMSDGRATSANEYPSVPSPAERLTGRALGIDIGGSGVKAAVVDVASGQLVTERIRELTPSRATPEALLGVVVDVVRRLEATGVLTPDLPAGAGFPSVIRAGQALTATQLHRSWIGAPVQEMLEQRLGRPMVVLNDADAAGVGEMALGAGQGQSGVVLLLALGTGIGSALFIDGQLVPNLQLGHVEFHCRDAESRLSSAARTRRKMGWKEWGGEFSELLARYETADLSLAGPHHPRWRPRQEVLEVPEVPQDTGRARGGGDGQHGRHRRRRQGRRERGPGPLSHPQSGGTRQRGVATPIGANSANSMPPAWR